MYCGEPATTIDHLDPVSRGGRTVPGNVAPACVSCNSRKKDKTFDAWLDELEDSGPLRDELVEVVAHYEARLR